MDNEDDAPFDGGGDDLRASLLSAMSGDDGGSQREADHSADTPVEGDGAAPAKSAVDRARHPDGKFAPKPADAPAPGAEETKPAAPAAPTETAPAAATRPAPQSWSAETKDGWATLPPAIQDQVLKREAEVNTVLQQSANARRYAGAIEQVTTPHRDLLAREGVDVPTAVSNLLSFHAFFDRDPAGCIAHLQQLAAQRGNRPAPPPGGAPQPPAAPQRQASPPIDVQRLVRQEIEQHHQQQTIASDIASFATANPHFEAAKPTMALLIRTAAAAGQTMTMQDAYDRAIWADPAIRQTLLAAQAAPAVPQQAVAQAPVGSDPARVARARAAAGSVRGAPSGNGGAKPVERTLREELEANILGR